MLREGPQCMAANGLSGMVYGVGDLQYMDTRGFVKKSRLRGEIRSCLGVSGVSNCSNSLLSIGQITVRV